MFSYLLQYKGKEVLVFEEKEESPSNQQFPFIFTDLLTEYAGKKQQLILHFWSLPNTIILGMKDTRLKQLDKGITQLIASDYQVVLRNSGGLAVVADSGVLNLSLILPITKEKALSIDDAYLLMANWIRQTFETETKKIEAFEIKDSYCPGTFDLSIHGKKFAGISQRRVKGGIAVMIYLSVNGDQGKRGQAIRNFYTISGADSNYPRVNPNSLATLADLLEENLTVTQVKTKLLASLTRQFQLSVDPQTLVQIQKTTDWQQQFSKQRQKMAQRNECIAKIKEALADDSSL